MEIDGIRAACGAACAVQATRVAAQSDQAVCAARSTPTTINLLPVREARAARLIEARGMARKCGAQTKSACSENSAVI